MHTISPGPGSAWAQAFLAVNAFARRTPWLHAPLAAYAKDGVVLFAVLLLAGWWVARGSRDPARVAAALWGPIGVLLAVAVNQPVVAAWHEARPYAVLPHVLVLVQRTTDPSAPSDHATMVGAAAACLLFVDRRLGIGTAVAAALMAFARVYVGAHYPHDVLAGLALGALVGVVGSYVTRRPPTGLITRLTCTRLRPLLVAGDPQQRPRPTDERPTMPGLATAPARR